MNTTALLLVMKECVSLLCSSCCLTTFLQTFVAWNSPLFCSCRICEIEKNQLCVEHPGRHDSLNSLLWFFCWNENVVKFFQIHLDCMKMQVIETTFNFQINTEMLGLL